VKVNTAVKEFLSAKRTLSPLTVRSYKQRLCVFADWCTQHGFTLETLTARAVRTFIEDMGRRPGLGGHPMQNSTVHCYATDVKTFLSWCAREEDFEGLVSTKIAARVESPPVETKVIEVFTDVQIAAFFRAAEEGDSAVRDRALLALLIDTGARASEVVGLTLDCTWLDPDDSYILVRGKGKKQREIGLGRVARMALRRYVTRYRRPDDRSDTHVFIARTGLPLTVSGLGQLIVRLGKKAGITGVRVSPHTFRHGFACAYLIAGGDLYKLSRLMGHTSVKVTERYLGAIKARQARQGGYSVLDHLKDS